MYAAERVQEFQRNTAFVAFVLVVCLACFVYLTQSLASVLIPIVWSAFFALPLTALISKINEITITGCSWLLRLMFKRPPHARESVQFRTLPGKNVVVVERTPEAVALVEKVNNPCIACCGIKCCRWRGFRWLCKMTQCCGRRRVRISRLVAQDSGGVPTGSSVNRIVENWAYYIKDVAAESSSPLTQTADVENMQLHFFVDHASRYPAVLEGAPSGDGQQPCTVLEGTLEVDKTSILSWTFAFLLTLSVVVLGVWVFVLCVSVGATAFSNNVGAYQSGVQEFIDWMGSELKHVLPPDTWEGLQKQLQHFESSTLPNLASTAVAFVESVAFQAILFIIYLLFWICEPLPISSSVAIVFKNYLLLKTTVCLLYAGLMSLLLLYLQCHLWHVFFIATFVLNYIPEFGAMASAALMVPAIIFDGNVDIKTRQENLILLVIFGTLIKIVTANVVEVQMYATRGGQFMRMHPVVLMGLMMLCEALLGVTGMFLAIPIMAAVKYYMISADMPSVFLNPLLTFIEGDEAGPHKNFVDRHRDFVKQAPHAEGIV